MALDNSWNAAYIYTKQTKENGKIKYFYGMQSHDKNWILLEDDWPEVNFLTRNYIIYRRLMEENMYDNTKNQHVL